MEDLDPSVLAETLQRLLRGRSQLSLPRDRDGWVAIEEVCLAASTMLETTVRVDQVRVVGKRAHRLEISGARIREHQPRRGPVVPDILFHATTTEVMAAVEAQGSLQPGARRRIYLSANEADAWRAAHRLAGEPALLVVDTLRARRAGARFQRTRSQGMYTANMLPARHILNLREGYAEQWSAGGLPIRRFPDGVIRAALIQVTRRSGVTWEVAKGKLEDAETPERAAVREICEEMGVDVPMRMLRHVGDVRYGFLAPGGVPRLKTIFLYLMEPLGEMSDFAPSEREGIGKVAWFTIDEAVEAVTHSSLQPLMWRARELIQRHGLEACPSLAEPCPPD